MLLPTNFDRVITCANAKGGVYKTTLISNIGALLADTDRRVLIIDLDPQGNVADDLGYSEHPQNDHGQSLAGALIGLGAPTIIRDIRAGLDIIAGGEHLHRATPWLGQNPQAAVASLRTAIDQFVGEYELVLIDLPPGDRALRLAAFGATKHVITPVRSDASSAKGIRTVVEDINRLRDGENESIGLLGIIMVGSGESATVIKRRARRQVMTALEMDEEAPEFFLSGLRHLEKPAQVARERGMTFHELDQNADRRPFWERIGENAEGAGIIAPSAKSGAEDIEAIARELIQRITHIETAEYGDDK